MLFQYIFPTVINCRANSASKKCCLNFQRDSKKIIPNSFIATGLTLFSFGLFKKVIIADSFLPVSQDVFQMAASGDMVNCLYAWKGALSYTFQLYFDFSGYSDMAIGFRTPFRN